MKTNRLEDIYVAVQIRPSSDYGGSSFGYTPPHEDAGIERRAEDLARAIRQHCAEHIPSMDRNRGVSVRAVRADVCEFCEAPWTEASDEYNGGCCDDDCANEPTPSGSSPLR